MFNIIPNKGVDGVCFGDPPNKVEHIFGEPDEINSLDEDDIWEYSKKGISFFFDKEDLQLVKIEIEDVKVAVWGVQLMHESPEFVENAIKNNTLEEVSIINKPKPALFYCIDSLGLDFYFEDKKLTIVTAEEPNTRK